MEIKKFKSFFFSLLVFQLSLLSLVSCQKEDNEGATVLTEEEKAMDAATRFWNVVGQLVDMDDFTEDYKDMTFEPTIGTESEDDPLTRVVSINNMEVAARRFANLVGAEIDENTVSYSWSDPDVGALFYHKSTDGRSWATVSVNIKQIPHLERIVYQSSEQGNLNGAFDGKAYYRFGDVVSREKKYGTEYWICVRPAFSKENKEESHWVCLNVLSSAQVMPKKVGDKQYYFPRYLVSEDHNRQNFAEMLYAICYPQEWEENIINYSTGKNGLPFFTDFHRDNLAYHNHLFWENVQKGWDSNDIVKLALNLDNLDVLRNTIESDGMCFIYSGEAKSTFYQLGVATYSNGSKSSHKNMHQSKMVGEWKESIGRQNKLDFRLMGSALENYSEFFKDNKFRWIIRHQSGSELSSTGRAPVDAPLSGCETVYRYYDQYPDEWNKGNLDGTSPEITQ